MPPGRHNQRDHGNQGTVGTRQVTARIDKTGDQNHKEHRGDEHFKAHVLGDKLGGETQLGGKGTDNGRHHDHLADGRSHGRHPILELETVVTAGQVHAPASGGHDLKLVLKVLTPALERGTGLTLALIVAIVVHCGAHIADIEPPMLGAVALTDH